MNLNDFRIGYRLACLGLLLGGLLAPVVRAQDCNNPPWPLWCNPPTPCAGYVESEFCDCLLINGAIYDGCMAEAESVAQAAVCALELYELNQACVADFGWMAQECCTGRASYAMRRRGFLRRIVRRFGPQDETPQGSVLRATLRVKHDLPPRLGPLLPPM